MQDIIDKLRHHHQYFNPPANQAQLDMLIENQLRMKPRRYQQGDDAIDPVFDDVITLYKDHNGMPFSPDVSPFPIRLMSVEESYGWNAFYENLGWKRNNQYLLWTDDNWNFLGIYLSEPLTGCIFTRFDVEPVDIPTFRNLREFYEALLLVTKNISMLDKPDRTKGWWNAETTFPKLQPDPKHDASDLVIARHYKNLSQNTDDYNLSQYYAMIALNFYPVSARQEMENLAIQSDDMYVESHAIDIFMKRKDADAIPTIELLIVAGGHNAKLAGILALGAIGGDDARDTLLRLAHDVDVVGHHFSRTIIESLEQLGVETKVEDFVFYYRLSDDSVWIEIPNF